MSRRTGFSILAGGIAALLLFPLSAPAALNFSGSFSGGATVDGGGGNERAYAVAVDTVSAGAPYVIVAGETESEGYPTCTVVKYDAAGAVVHSATMPGVSPRGLAVTASGDTVVAGQTANGPHGAVIRYNFDLTAFSSATFVSNAADAFNCVALGPSGDIYAGGYTSNGSNDDFLVVKYSPSLVLVSSEAHHVNNKDAVNGIAVSAAGQVVVTGAYGWSSPDYAIVGTFDADLRNTGEYKFMSYFSSCGNAAAFDTDGGILVAGRVRTVGGASMDFFVAKFESSLALVSSSTFDAGGEDVVHAMARDASGQVFLFGEGGSGMNRRMIAARCDSAFKVVSVKSPSTFYGDQEGNAAALAGGSLYVAGRINGDMYSRSLDATQFTADTVAPGAVTDLAVAQGKSMGTTTSVNLNWTMPGSDGMTGALPYGSAFRIRCATSAAGSWETYGVMVSTDLPAGTPLYHIWQGLTPGATVYFRIWVFDGINWSPASNTASFTPQLIAGDPAHVQFNTSGATGDLTVQRGVGTPSPISVRLVDDGWVNAVATAPVTITLAPKVGTYNATSSSYDYLPDTAAVFSLTPDFAVPVTSVTVPTGGSGAQFYYKTYCTSDLAAIYLYSFLDAGWPEPKLWLRVISGGISNASVHKGDFVRASSVTVATGESAYIDFDVPASPSGYNWQVLISSSPDRSHPIWSYYGWGQPVRGQVSWNGDYSYFDPAVQMARWGKSPSGMYYVRIQIGTNGGVTDDSLSIRLNTLDISGRVTDEKGLPLQGVNVQTFGADSSYAQTDAGGGFVLAGLKGGIYNLRFIKAGYPDCTLENIAAGTAGLSVTMTTPALIRLGAVRDGADAAAALQDAWTNAQLYTSDYRRSYNANLHFSLNVSTADNGMWVAGGTPGYELDNSSASLYTGGRWSYLQVSPGTYTLHAELPGYSVVNATGIVVNAGDYLVLPVLRFRQKGAISGTITLPAPAATAIWPTVDIIPAGGTAPTLCVGAMIAQGASSGTYTLSGITPGTYTLRAYVPGYRRASLTLTITDGQQFVTAPELALSDGGGLSGTITVEGDSTDPSLNLSGDPYTLYVNAWSPDSSSYGWTQVSLSKSVTSSSASFAISGLDDGTYWISSWLNGFELDGSYGGNGIKTTVTGGAGTVNLSFKKYSGTVQLRLIVPGNDYAHTRVCLQGGSFYNNDWQQGVLLTSAASFGASFDPATGVLTSPKLGTGFYQVKGIYDGTGYEKERSVMVVNGQERAVELALTADSWTVSGRVKLSAVNPPEGWTDASFGQLVDTVPFVQVNGGYPNQYYLTPTLSTTTFRVLAIDYAKIVDAKEGSQPEYGAKNGLINPDGTYRIAGLTPGVYLLRVRPLELNGADDGKETAVAERRIVVTGSDIVDADLELSRGSAVSGLLSLPSGEKVTREMYVYVYGAKQFKVKNYANAGDYLGSVRAYFYDSNTASYTVKGLAAGEYVIAAQDWGYSYLDNTLGSWVSVPRQYANSSIPVKVDASDLLGKNIQLSKGGTITLKLRDVDSGTVITPKNRQQLLPPSCQITATASPWVEGGWVMANTPADRESFELSFLPEGTYDVAFGAAGTATAAATAMAGSGVAYAAKTVAGVRVESGRTVDLGTLEIRQGFALTGTVKDRNGNGIPNAPVVALPSLSKNWSSELQALTDINGRYSISGINPEVPYYDVIACPRVDSSLVGGYVFYGNGGISYGEKVRTMVRVKDAGSVDFTLTEANGSLRGRVVTEDGGMLSDPDDANVPVAQVYLQPEDTFPRTNPVGDIMVKTSIQGEFTIEALSAGTYRLTVLCGGYSSFSKSVTIGSVEADAGTVTLKRGARVAGRVAKADGSNPSVNEVRNVAAATDDLSEVVMGALRTSGEKTVTGYELNGLQPGRSYNLLFLSPDDELIPALPDYSVPFSSYTKTDLGLTFRVTPPAIFARVKREGNRYTVSFDLTGPVRRQLPSDDELPSLLTLAAGAGTLSDLYLSADRCAFGCTYTAPAGETGFTLRLRFVAKAIDPGTGTGFPVDQSFNFYSGIGARNSVRISNLRGGRVTLDDDSSTVVFAPGAFEVGAATAAVGVEFSRAEKLEDMRSAAAPGAPRLALPRSPAAYPDRITRAAAAARATSVDPFSAFYDVLLPQGVSRAFRKNATLSLQYGAGANQSAINVYCYDEAHNAFLLATDNRQVDPAACTISVSIDRAGVFVVLAANTTELQGGAYNGPLFVYNYPNPFDLSRKTVTLVNAGAQQRTTEGTIMHYGLPQKVSGDVRIRVYTVAGELVRTIADGARAGGSHYYTEWDGKNDAGQKVASGVYIARFTVDDKQERFFKMAVIK